MTTTLTICQLQEDQSIFRMRYLGEIEFGATVKNLTSEVGVSRSIFSNFPQQVKHDTAYERNCEYGNQNKRMCGARYLSLAFHRAKLIACPTSKSILCPGQNPIMPTG